jgi:hypothetical protein
MTGADPVVLPGGVNTLICVELTKETKQGLLLMLTVTPPKVVGRFVPVIADPHEVEEPSVKLAP